MHRRRKENSIESTVLANSRSHDQLHRLFNKGGTFRV